MHTFCSFTFLSGRLWTTRPRISVEGLIRCQNLFQQTTTFSSTPNVAPHSITAPLSILLTGLISCSNKSICLLISFHAPFSPNFSVQLGADQRECRHAGQGNTNANENTNENKNNNENKNENKNMPANTCRSTAHHKMMWHICFRWGCWARAPVAISNSWSTPYTGIFIMFLSVCLFQ